MSSLKILSSEVNILGGTEVTVRQDSRGDIWESVRQLPFFEDGKMTPLGKLADFYLMKEGE